MMLSKEFLLQHFSETMGNKLKQQVRILNLKQRGKVVVFFIRLLSFHHKRRCLRESENITHGISTNRVPSIIAEDESSSIYI